MRFGVREICDVTFRPLQAVDFGDQHFEAMQPCLFLDTATTSTLEGAATTVYAQGGKGNPRLIAWEGEKTVTFTVTDALISPISFAMLSGAGVLKGDNTAEKASYVHTTFDGVVVDGAVKIPDEPYTENGANIYGYVLDSAGAVKHYLTGELEYADGAVEIKCEDGDITAEELENAVVRLDYYVEKKTGVTELMVDAKQFAGYYYIEADTLFRDEATGVDMPANFIIPRGKIQSNFTFTMAASGDPSTFDFTIDAFPAYTRFNKAKKVLFSLQIVEEGVEKHDYSDTDIHGHEYWGAKQD